MTSQRGVRQLLARVWREHATPTRLGLAVGLGVFVGCSPLYGLQTLIGLGLATVLRLNKVAVLLGTQISIPPLAPFLAYCNIQLGSLILTGHPLDLHPSALSLTDLLARFALAWTVGSIPGGLALGATLGTLAGTVQKRKLSRTPHRHQREKDEGGSSSLGG